MTERSPDAPAGRSSREDSTRVGSSGLRIRALLVAAVVASVLLAGGFAPIAVAQDGGAPTVPAAYYGDVTIDGDPASVGTEIVAVVDGEERGSITVETEGEYGGPDALDEKLVVEGVDPGDAVSFEVRGVAAAETVTWESGDVQEVDLTFEDVPAETDGGSGSDAGNGGSSGGAPAGGGGAAAPGGATTTPTDGRSAADNETQGDTEVVSESTANISAASNGNESRATFDDDTPVSEIRFEESADDGAVSVSELSNPPAETGDPPGESVVVSEIRVPDGMEDAAATLRLTVSDERLDSIAADAADLRVNRFSDGEWQSLETRIVEDGPDGVVLAAETPGFSYFAVSAAGKPTADARLSPEQADVGSSVTLNGSASAVSHGEIVSYDWAVGDREVNGETATLQIDQSGEYTVELTVTTDAGRTDTATRTLVIAEEGEADASTAGADTASLEGGTAAETTSGGVDREAFGGMPSPWLLGAVLLLLAVGVAAVAVRNRGSSSDERL